MKYVLVVIIIFLSLSCMAQSNVSGIVQDSITKHPLEMANITLVRDGKPISFTRTNEEGGFKIQAKPNDFIVVTFLGYQKKTVTITEQPMVISLIPEAFNLKEVEVKGGRILGRADTITYDLGCFSNERDNSLNDVLKKLPGIDVGKNGQITYNGKAIDRFTIEGLDLTGGKYNKINETLKPSEVDKAEVIEHDQPIKALRDKVFTDNVAMNIKLKDEARDQWLGSLSLSKPIVAKSICDKADILQLGKTRQQMYNIESDMMGRDIYAANQRLTSILLPSSSLPTLPSFHHNPTLSFPIDDERMRLNSSYDIRFAKTAKNKNENEMRWGTEYLHSSESQQTSNNTLYYLGDNTKIMSEESNLLRNVDKITLDYTQKKNNDKAYGNKYLLIEGSRTRTLSTIETMEKLSEKTKTPHLHISNSLHRIFVKKHHQYSLSSIIDFQHSPTSLSINDEDDKLTISQCYVDHHFSMMFPRLRNTLSYQMGCTFHHLNVGKRWTKYVIDGETRWEMKRKHITWRMVLPIRWEYYTPTNKGYLCLTPHVFMDKTWKKRHEIMLYTQFNQQVDEWDKYLLPRYIQDYRTTVYSNVIIPINRQISVSANYTYKRPVKELFITFRGNWSHAWNGSMIDMQIIDSRYLMTVVSKKNQVNTYRIGFDLSKGFFDLHLKNKISVSYLKQNGKQLSFHQMYDYHNYSLNIIPEFTYSPTWCDITYQSSYSFNRSKTGNSHLSSIFQCKQSLSFIKTIGNIDVGLSTVYYHNEIQSSSPINTLLFDTQVVWRIKKMRLTLQLRNLFNQTTYAITTFSDIHSSTTNYLLRPREMTVKIQFSL